jgi:glycogen(starch) synthase
MKVLVVSNLYPPEFLGGYELACSQMVDALTGLGHDVRVVTSVSAHAHDRKEESVERTLELPPIYSPSRMTAASEHLRQYFQLLACDVNPTNVRALGEAIEEFDPDVAYLWNILGLGGLGVLALLQHAGVPWVWHIEDLIPRQLCTFGATGAQLARELGNVFPGRYIMCSSHVLGEIRAGGVEMGDHVQVIPNWVVGERPPPREQFFRGGELRILNASGTLSEEKGAPILVEAAAELRRGGSANFTIDLYGRDPDPRLRTLLHQHEVTDIVRRMGPRTHDELLALYPRYDVFAFPTWAREPFGFVALEAAAAGCLPVISHECGIAEWLIDGVDCLKAPRSATGFAEILAKVVRGEVDLPAMARRAQEVVWREFHISRVAAKVEQTLSEAASERRPAYGGTGEFFKLASFAEGLIQTLLQEAQVA